MYSNIYFYLKQVDYFSQYDNPSYILHFWYISLQQQIYLLFPILFNIFIYKRHILLSLCCISFIFFSFFIFYDPSYAYYIVICRLYEFILGIFLNNRFNIDKDSLIISIKNKIVFAMIFLQLIDINFNTLLKYIAINSLSFFLLLSITNTTVENSFILNTKILCLIGNISYELYLIHYPFIILHIKCEIIYFSAVLLITSILSYVKLINRKILFLFSLFLPFFIILYTNNNKISLSSKFKNKIIAPKIDPNQEYSIILRKIKIYNPIANRNIYCYFLLGDSHLQQWFPSIIRIAKRKKYGIIHIYFHANIIEMNKVNHIINRINSFKKRKSTTISSFYLSNVWIKNISNFRNPFQNYIKIISKYSERVYLIEDIPFIYKNPLDCIYSKKERNKCYAILGVNASLTSLPHIKNFKIKYCNMNKYIYMNNKIPFIKNGYIVYKDTNHLTLSFSDTLTLYVDNCLIN